MQRNASDLRGVEFIRNFKRRAQNAVRTIGNQEAAALKVDLSVPVVYRQNALPQRSLPGEAPRRDEGKLMASVDSVIFADEGAVGVRVQAGGPEAPYAGTLERGGSSNFGFLQARPFMYPSHERMKRRAESQIVSLLRGKA